MLRYLLILVLIAIVARAFWRVVDGVVEGMRGGPAPPGRTRVAGVPMERDPVCGTFVVRERAITLGSGDRRVYFCSAVCRDKYEAPRHGSGQARQA
jgi:YHS domain-containing protein